MKTFALIAIPALLIVGAGVAHDWYHAHLCGICSFKRAKAKA